MQASGIYTGDLEMLVYSTEVTLTVLCHPTLQSAQRSNTIKRLMLRNGLGWPGDDLPLSGSFCVFLCFYGVDVCKETFLGGSVGLNLCHVLTCQISSHATRALTSSVAYVLLLPVAAAPLHLPPGQTHA